jgi:hypothetical protein
MDSQQTWPPWNPKLGWRDKYDYTSGDSREWGVDVPLPAGTAVFAPEAGTVIAYQPSATDWPRRIQRRPRVPRQFHASPCQEDRKPI